MGKTAAELREEIELQRAEVGRDLDAIGDRVSPGRIVERKTEAVKQKFRGVKDSVMGTADDANESLQDGMQSAKDGMQSAKDSVAALPDKVRTTTEGNPLAVGLVAFGLGLIAASLIPPSKKEQQLGRQLQPQLEDAARRASDAGRELVDDLKPEVTKAVDQVKQQATESAHTLSDQAKQGAEAAAQTAKSSAQSPANSPVGS